MTYKFGALSALAERFGAVVQGRVEREYGLLAPYLGAVDSVLDIGCGIGFMDIMLARYHETKHIHLLDGDGSGLKKLGYNDEDTTPWNDVNIGAAFVRDNVPADVEVNSYVRSTNEWPDYVDLVMSFWSWGFHYPTSVYAQEVARRFPNADIILDIRPQTKGGDALREAGYTQKVIVEKNNKAHRIIFSR